MTLAAQAIEPHEVLAYLASELRCERSVSALRTAVIADHIRSLVWAPYLRAAEPIAEPVHTARLFAALDRNIPFLPSAGPASDGLHAEYQSVRTQLELLGDIVDAGGGYWMPGPIRVVEISGSQAAMVLGGAPTSALQRMLRSTIHSIGPARYLPRGPTGGPPPDAVADWLGMTEPLANWTERLLSWATSRLQPQAGILDESIEIYAPDLFRDRGSMGFWMSAKEFRERAPTLRLFRPKAGPQWSFNRPDYLGIFSSQTEGARLVRAVGISRQTAYRLRFGFDQRLALPRTVTARRTRGTYRVELPFGLPHPEDRVLGLAWREHGDEAAHFFDPMALPVLSEVTAALGIVLRASGGIDDEAR